MEKIDLNKCKAGDILISSHGAILEYVSPTPWKHYTYLDHVVKYIKDEKGNLYGEENYGTRTNDGFTYAKKRIPEVDHDIVKIIRKEPSIKRTDVGQYELEVKVNTTYTISDLNGELKIEETDEKKT
jgi:hypothetical protein